MSSAHDHSPSMAIDADAVFGAALKLPAEKRAMLADKLLESLVTEASDDILAAWVKEAEQRLADYREGRASAVPVEEVLTGLDARFGQ